MGIDIVPADTIEPYAKNSRTHSAGQVEQIEASLEEFGMVGAVVVRAGVIAKGHGTFAAIQRIYGVGRLLYPAPGKKRGAEPYPAGHVPIIDASGWTDAQFRAFVIADNKLAEGSGWNADVLNAELDDLASEEFDIGLTGFDAEEISELLAPSKFEKSMPANFKEEESGDIEYKNLGKYPVTVILDEQEFAEWSAAKEKRGASDKRLMLELLRGEK